MAIIFTPNSESPITIGGTAGTGPFPRHSITRDIQYSDDNSYIGDKFTINVIGTIVAVGDITVSGEKQNNIYGKVINYLKIANSTNDVFGRLEIVPYGGLANALDFLDARLISVNIPENSNESAGVQTQEVNFVFEALQFNDLNPLSYRLARTEETWEISENDGQFTLSGDDLSEDTPVKTYSINHTVSATGLKKFDSGTVLNDDGTPWRQAQLWVMERLQESPTIVTEDSVGNPTVTFNTDYFSKNSSSPPIDISLYGFYNKVRSINSSIIGGSYSVTDTYFVSKSAAKHEVEVNLEQSEDGIATVSVNGTVTGLSSALFAGVDVSDRYTNALSSYNNIKSTIQSLANSVYTEADIDGTLRTTPKTSSVGHNKIAGTITYNYSYDDKTLFIPNAISSTLNITYDNEKQTSKIVAVIDIIGKADGPVIQDMGTTPKRSRIIELTATMSKGYRTEKPDGMSHITAYIPTGTVYQQPEKETWQPDTGAYSLSVEWIF